MLYSLSHSVLGDMGAMAKVILYPDELVFKLYERKGRCFMSLGRPNEAATCFEEALMKGGVI